VNQDNLCQVQHQEMFPALLLMDLTLLRLPQLTKHQTVLFQVDQATMEELHLLQDLEYNTKELSNQVLPALVFISQELAAAEVAVAAQSTRLRDKQLLQAIKEDHLEFIKAQVEIKEPTTKAESLLQEFMVLAHLDIKVVQVDHQQSTKAEQVDHQQPTKAVQVVMELEHTKVELHREQQAQVHTNHQGIRVELEDNTLLEIPQVLIAQSVN
jgi:hypothetical protein